MHSACRKPSKSGTWAIPIFACGTRFSRRSAIRRTIGRWSNLRRKQQEQFVEDEPDVFAPVKGGWGRKGATRVDLAEATAPVVRPALIAWKNVAPKKLVSEWEEKL